MQNNPEIEQIIDHAVRIARDKHHYYVVTEHLLAAMLDHAPFRAVLIKFGADVTRLEEELHAWLDAQTTMRREGDDFQENQHSRTCVQPRTHAGTVYWSQNCDHC